MLTMPARFITAMTASSNNATPNAVSDRLSVEDRQNEYRADVVDYRQGQ